MADHRPDYLEGQHVKHANGRAAIVMSGPMRNFHDTHWVCRVRFIDDGVEGWEFAEDLNVWERKPLKEEKR